jgi:hypothetical protein
MPSAEDAQAWWPPMFRTEPPDDLRLVLVSARGTPHERWRVESWPCIGIDGRLRHGTVVADQPADGSPEVPPSPVGAAVAELVAAETPVSSVGAALEALGWPGADAPTDRAVLAAHAPGTAGSDRRGPAWLWPSPRPPAYRLAAIIRPEAWDAALAAVWRPCAWTYWPDWRGDPELIAHVGQAIRWAFRDVIGSDANVQTTIGVGADDAERFDEPKAVVTEVTAYGARHMRTVKIECASEKITVLVRVNRGDDQADEVLSKAVLLEVTSSAPEAFVLVRAIHARVRAAIERGLPGRLFGSESVVGHLALDDAGRAVPHVARRPADAAAGRNQGWVAFALLLYFALVVVLTTAGQFVSSATLLVIGAIVVAALGGLAAASVFAGGIMLGTSNRVLKLRARVVGLAGGAVSVGVGAGVKQLADLL